MKKYFLAFIFILSFFIARPSLAYDYDIQATTTHQQYFSLSNSKAYGQSFIPNENNLAGIRLAVWLYDSPYVPTALYVYLCKGLQDYYNFESIVGCDADTDLIATAVVDETELLTWDMNSNGDTEAYYHDIYFPSPVEVTPDEFYYFKLQVSGNTDTGVNIYFANTGYTDGNFIWQYGNYPQPTYSTSTLLARDLSFYTYYDPEFVSQLLAVDYPPSSTTTPLKDFGSWTLHFTYSTSSPFHVGVRYGLSPSTMTLSDDLLLSSNYGYMALGLQKENTLQDNMYYFYQAYLSDGTSDIATTSVSYFLVDKQNGLGQYNPLPTSTASSTDLNITCDEESGFFANSLCNLYQFLFIPSADNATRFTDLKSDLENKPPFGYWSLISDAFSGIGTTTSDAYYAESSSATGFDNIDNYLKGMTTIFIWIAFAIGMIKSLKRLQI